MKLILSIILSSTILYSCGGKKYEDTDLYINNKNLKNGEFIIVKGKYQSGSWFYLVDSNRNTYQCEGVDYALAKEGDTLCIKK